MSWFARRVLPQAGASHRYFHYTRCGLKKRYLLTPVSVGLASVLTYEYYLNDSQILSNWPYFNFSASSDKNVVTMLTPAQVDQRLHQDEMSYAVSTKNNPTSRFDINFVNSNLPIEDDHCFAEIGDTDESSDYFVFGVFDGHSGWLTSRTLAMKLVPFLAEEIKEHKDEPVDTLLKKSMKKFDDIICYGPIQMARAALKNGVSGEGNTSSKATDEKHARLINAAQVALSGSCALVSVLDLAKEKLHIAVTGDCRAVMGQWDPSTNKWTAEVLTEDQTGLTPSEIERMKREHPGEDDTVIRHGRVLGHLQPTRAFGDARYKWTLEEYNDLVNAVSNRGAQRKIKPVANNYLTPPYVTASPEVCSIDIKSSPKVENARNKPPVTRFLVMATDGLYDMLSSEQVIALVAAHIEGTKGNLSNEQLGEFLSKAPSDHAGKMFSSSSSPYDQNLASDTPRWSFKDSNLATHLIRNAFGGAITERLGALLSLPAPMSRNYRDDITISVILLDGEKPVGGKHIQLRADDLSFPSSKL